MNTQQLYHTSVAGVFNAVPAPSTSGTQNPQDWFIKSLGITESDSDINVDANTALTSGPIWEAVNIIAGDVGLLPAHVYRRIDDQTKEIDRKHPASTLLRRKPHPEMLPFHFKEAITADALLWGNGVAFIRRSGTIPIALTRTEPSRTRVERIGGKLKYITRDDTGKEFWAWQEDVLHIIGFGNGMWGVNVFEFARNSWGMHLALQKHGNRQFANGAIPGGIISYDGKMDKGGRAGLRQEWNEVHQGTDNAGEVAVLTRGMTYTPISMPNKDAEWLGSLRYSREDVACWFKLPAHKLNSMENSSVRANIEERNREYLNQCLAQWLKRWEEESERKLLTRQQFDNETHFIRFNTAAILKGDFKSQVESLALGRQAEIYSINDCRDKLDENGIGPEGDEYMNPNTSSPNGPSEPPEEDDEPTETKPTEASRLAMVQLATEAIQKIYSLEKRELLKAGEKPDKFGIMLTHFYQRSQSVLCDALAPVVRCGKTLAVTPPHVSAEGLAQSWVYESFDRMTVVRAECDSGELLRAVESELKKWPARHDKVLQTILEG